jgi:hypothetical protein
MAGWKCISDFSALSSSNVRTGPEMNVGHGSFELKPTHINMVQQSPFCGKASEDANAHLQHFFEICSTFTIRGVTQDAVCLCLFPFSLLGKVKQRFYSNKEAVSSWEGEMLQCIVSTCVTPTFCKNKIFVQIGVHIQL